MNPADSKAGNHQFPILVVDDEEIVLIALRYTFRQLGHNVSTASDAAAGLALLRENTFAVVFTDLQMPELTGLESLAQVKQLQPGAARVLITAVLNLTTVINAINRAEVFRFLIKPWQREDLLETVQAATARQEVGQRDRFALAAAQSSVESLTSRLNALKDELALHRKA